MLVNLIVFTPCTTLFLSVYFLILDSMLDEVDSTGSQNEIGMILYLLYNRGVTPLLQQVKSKTLQNCKGRINIPLQYCLHQNRKYPLWERHSKSNIMLVDETILKLHSHKSRKIKTIFVSDIYNNLHQNVLIQVIL